MINRTAVLVRPRQPFVDWAGQLDDRNLLPDPEGERTVYLVPDCKDDIEAWRILEEGYADIFENELFAWHTIEADWPKKRTFEMFRAWFEIEISSIIEDFCDYELFDYDNEA